MAALPLVSGHIPLLFTLAVLEWIPENLIFPFCGLHAAVMFHFWGDAVELGGNILMLAGPVFMMLSGPRHCLGQLSEARPF